MNLELKGCVFIVTGGDKGIGGAISKGLCREGARVVIATRENPEQDKILSSLNQHEGSADWFTVELQEPEKRAELVSDVLDKYGRIDGLINNAGVNDGVSLESGSDEAFVESYHKNVVHAFSIVRHCLEALKKSEGVIINIGSKIAATGQGGTSGYAASKGALNALTREWAVDLARYNIRVNCVIPAEVWTPLYERWIDSLPNPKEKLNEIKRRIPLGKRFTTPEEIANMVLFLASNKVSAHTTGQILYVDGGYTHLDRALT